MVVSKHCYITPLLPLCTSFSPLTFLKNRGNNLGHSDLEGLKRTDVQNWVWPEFRRRRGLKQTREESPSTACGPLVLGVDKGKVCELSRSRLRITENNHGQKVAPQNKASLKSHGVENSAAV